MPKPEDLEPKMVDHPVLPNAHALPEEGPRPQHVNRASGICHPCMYHNYLARTRWADRKPWSPVFQQIFKRGKQTEADTTAAMLQLGLEVMRTQETLEWPDLQLTGHSDGVFRLGNIIEMMERDGIYVPAPALNDNPNALVAWDVKSQDPAVFGKYRSLEDLLAPLSGSSVYRWNYPGQLTLYAVHKLMQCLWCCIYFVNRSTYETIQVWWPTDHPLAQREVENAKNACKWINRAIAMPDREPQVVADELARPGQWCGGCAFGHVCERYLLTGDEIHIVKELTELVAQRVSAAAFKGAVEKDYKASNDRLKDIWKARHEEHGDHEVLCGDVLVKIKKARNGSIRPTYKPKGQAK